jgi:hypothetical protein
MAVITPVLVRMMPSPVVMKNIVSPQPEGGVEIGAVVIGLGIVNPAVVVITRVMDDAAGKGRQGHQQQRIGQQFS